MTAEERAERTKQALTEALAGLKVIADRYAIEPIASMQARFAIINCERLSRGLDPMTAAEFAQAYNLAERSQAEFMGRPQ